MEKVLFDKRELIEYLNGKLSYDTLGRLIRMGVIPTVKFPNIRRYFFDRDEIDRWLSNLSKQNMTKESEQLRGR